MIKLYFISIGILILTITIAAGIIKPGINKTVRFANDNFQITTTELAGNPEATHEIPENDVKIVNTEFTENKTIEKQIETKSPAAKEITKIIENKHPAAVKNIEIKKTETKVKTTGKNIITTPPKSETKTVKKEQTETQKQKTKLAVVSDLKNFYDNNLLNPGLPIKQDTKEKIENIIQSVSTNSNKVVELTNAIVELLSDTTQVPENCFTRMEGMPI